MLTYPEINPIALQIGPLAIHWYGVMYLIGFFVGWALLVLRMKRRNTGFDREAVADIVFYTALGVVIGGRVGYVLFYDWAYFISHPLFLVEVWKGGMSFHGGLVGVIVSLSIYAYRHHRSLLDITDFIVPVVPIGLGAGRLGNFINGELWGRVTDLPWGMIFPKAGDLPRHPSQLYELGLEGVLLFLIVWIYSSKPRPRGAVSGLFLILYGVFRFMVECVREPDPQVGYIALGWMTEGQLLSLPMIVIGMGLWCYAKRRNALCINI